MKVFEKFVSCRSTNPHKSTLNYTTKDIEKSKVCHICGISTKYILTEKDKTSKKIIKLWQ